MRIALVYNARPENIDRSDPNLEKYIEGDEWKTISAIGQAIEANNHSVTYYSVDPEIYKTLEKNRDQIDLVFNLSEGINGADREAQVPMLCEILGIPYTGPSPLSAALILNKSRAKEIWHSNSVTTAHSLLFPLDHKLLDVDNTQTFPLIVKPNNEGSGIGIHNHSLVHNTKELKHAIDTIHHKYHQAALAETYLPGREFTVAIVGNTPDLTLLPIVEINFAGLPKDVAPIDSYEAKFVYGATGIVPMHETELCPAKITKALEEQISTLAKSAYTTIGCRDFGRLDIRLDAKGVPHVLEINYPPGLMSDEFESSFFTISARTHGWDFSTLIGKIIDTARARLQL